MPITEIVALAKDALIAIAAAVTATVAVIGLSNWNRELKGKATFEVARGLAKATYNLREEIENCGAPFIAANEFPEGYDVLGLQGKVPDHEEANVIAHAYGNRWKPVGEALQEFDANTLEAEAIWGGEIRTKTEALRQCVRELNTAIWTVVDDGASGGENFRLNPLFRMEMQSRVSTASGPDNAKPQN